MAAPPTLARTDTALRGPGGSGVGILTALVLVATLPTGCSRSLRPASLDEGDAEDAGGPRADAAGADSDSGATDGEDGGPPPAADCPAMDATLVLCPPPPPVPRPPVPAAWVDDRCIEIPPGSCAGEDCDDLYRGLAACEAATAGCDAALCRTTGGALESGGGLLRAIHLRPALHGEVPPGGRDLQLRRRRRVGPGGGVPPPPRRGRPVSRGLGTGSLRGQRGDRRCRRVLRLPLGPALRGRLRLCARRADGLRPTGLPPTPGRPLRRPRVMPGRARVLRDRPPGPIHMPGPRLRPRRRSLRRLQPRVTGVSRASGGLPPSRGSCGSGRR